MTDFGYWFARQGVPTPAPVDPPAQAEEAELPEGVWEGREPGAYFAQCRSCKRDYELPHDVEDFDPEYAYCMGSDRCLP